MAKKGWIVAGKNFEYNDEYYNETDGSHPIKVYTDKEAAERAAVAEAIKEVKGIDYSSYFNGGDDEDRAFLDQYFKMVKGKESDPEKAKALTEAKRIVRQEATITWAGQSNGIKFKIDDLEDYEKIITKNNATIIVGYDRKRMSLAELKKAIDLVQNATDSQLDLRELRHEVNMSKLTDAQIEKLLPLMPMTFVTVIETTIE